MIDVKETLLSAEEKMEMGVMHLEEQLSRVRAGRASIAVEVEVGRRFLRHGNRCAVLSSSTHLLGTVECVVMVCSYVYVAKGSLSIMMYKHTPNTNAKTTPPITSAAVRIR